MYIANILLYYLFLIKNSLPQSVSQFVSKVCFSIYDRDEDNKNGQIYTNIQMHTHQIPSISIRNKTNSSKHQQINGTKKNAKKKILGSGINHTK
jgi:hypothetical protein